MKPLTDVPNPKDSSYLEKLVYNIIFKKIGVGYTVAVFIVFIL